MPTACASCPFRIGNSEEFGAVVERLRAAEGLRGKTTPKIVGNARMALIFETENRGDFICHCTAYDAGMTLKPETEHRQCAGATLYYRDRQLTR